jgi:magnesium chelatase family protein
LPDLRQDILREHWYRSEESAAIRERILAARQSQFRRLEPFGIFCNAQMTAAHAPSFLLIGGESEKLMENAIRRLRQGVAALPHLF